MVFFPPLPKIQCKKLFRFLESLMKIIEKKRSHICELLLIKSVKSRRQKKKKKKNSVLQCQNFLDFWNPCGKSNGKEWSQIIKLLLIKGVKLRRKKRFFKANFALLTGFFWYWCYHPHRSRDALYDVCEI